ncbi:MAG: TauD/TfdA family dioxygenase [Caldilineaceae bacterium]
MATGTLLVSPLTATYGTVISNDNGESVLDLDERQIVDLFSRSGALVLRGFNSTLDEFRTFTDCYGSDFLTYQGGGFRFRSFDRRAINDESTILSVTGGSQGFPMPLHGEMFYLKIRPRILWFRCEIPPERDGETTLGDGAEIFAALSPATQELLRTPPFATTAPWPTATGRPPSRPMTSTSCVTSAPPTTRPWSSTPPPARCAPRSPALRW